MGRLLRRALLVALILAAAAGVGWHLHVKSARDRFEARVAKLRAAGEPTRFTDLATPPIPDEENAAKLLEEAQRVLKRREDDAHEDGTRDDILAYKNDRTPEEQARLMAYLDSLKPYFELLARVPDRPGWRPDLDWNAGLSMRTDFYSWLHEAQDHVVALIENDRRETGRTERAAKGACLLLSLGAKCRGPYVIGYLIADSVASGSAQVLRVAMKQPGFDAALFRKIVDSPLARSIPERGPPRHVLLEDRAFGIGTLKAIADGAYYDILEKRTVSWFQLPRLYRSGEHFLDVVEKALEHSDTTPENALDVAAEIGEIPEIDDPWFGNSGRVYSRIFRMFADRVAGRRLTRVVMALLEHRQREGTWPESLDALGEMPLDPYTKKPFQYERTDHGCEVRCAKMDTPEDLEDRYLLWTLEDDQMPAMKR